MKYYLPALLVILTLGLRLPNLRAHLTLSFDQVRDLTEVTKMLEIGKPLLLGPIVKGVTGGFYLGPWYYYLITPLVFLTNGSPFSLSVISVGTDVLVTLGLYYLLCRHASRPVAALAGVIWACSPLVIRGSYTAWNVSLIPLWSLAFIASWGKSRGWLVFLSSFATSIHASLLPLCLVGLAFNWRLFTKLNSANWGKLLVIFLLPLIPLILHDLTHHFENSHLIKFFLLHGRVGDPAWSATVTNVLVKLGYTIGRLFTGEPLTWIGTLLGAVLLIYGLSKARTSYLLKASVTLALSLIFSLILYRDPNFAEYYFNALLVPFVILFAYILAHLPRPVIMIVIILNVGLGINVAKNPPLPESLAGKSALVRSLKKLSYPVEVHYKLPANLEVGLPYLIERAGASYQGATRQAYIYPVEEVELISPENARSIISNEPVGLYKLVVFSN